MKNNLFRFALVLGSALLAVSTAPRADDIDIFLVRTGVTSTEKPNILFMVDNTPNWSRKAQKWPDNGGTQGAAELAAIATVVSSQSTGTYMGLASYTQAGDGGYIRFGVRDMDVSDNKNGLARVLNHMRTNITSSSEKVNSGGSGYETSAMFEAYRYFKSMSVFRGAKTSTEDPAKNVDIAGNDGAGGDSTAHRVGLTSGHAYSGSNYTFSGTASGCGTNALIMVVNNAQGSIPSGSQTYTASDGTTSAGTSLPAIPGVSDISWTDEWARFLYQSGITVYILDAYNAQQNVSHSKTLERAAAVGGGKYYAVKNQAEIEKAIGKIVAEINAKDSTFASAALPVSASNRSQYLNQVFIGMFRPDPDAEPQWLGNLKRYKLGVTSAGEVELQDAIDANAINSQTGFVHECAVSEWTTDTGSFWTDVKGLAITASACTAFPTVDGVTGSAWSDLPDGPTVAKGGVAEVLRRGNNPPSFRDWTAINRNILTYDASAATKLTSLTATAPDPDWTSSFFNWVTGRDDDTVVDSLQPYSEYITPSTTARVRPSIHGDVIHSKPLPVNYGGSTGVVVYYGANDGMLRAVSAETGKERWSYVAPEHYAKFKRLKDQSPLVYFPGLTATPATQKDYFFDGSTGLYQNLDNSSVWIYPSQRRGGRMLHGFDVTNPDSPRLAWRVGCPNLADDTGCTSGFSNIGQTWSTPTVAMIAGQTDPVVIVGGGYDACDDGDTPTPACASRKGNVVYILNGFTGAIIKSFPSLDGSVAADIALADRNGDGNVDFAYAVTTAGSVYRINFTNGAFANLLPANWGIQRIGYTSGGGRKFQNTPALMPSGTKMYVGMGSGDREKPLIGYYPYVTQVTNRFYVLTDDLADPTATVTAVNMDDPLQMQDFTSETSCSTSGISQSTTYKGWFMNLPGRGEQTVTSAVAVGGMVTFSTNRPYAGTTSTCNVNANLGEARGYWLNILNASGAIGAGNSTCGGDRSATFVQGGLVPSPTVATVQIGNQVRTVALGAIQRSGGASSGIAPQGITPPIQAKRRLIFWRSNQEE